MIAAELVCKVEVLMETGEWIAASFGQLETGDVFRLIEPNGAIIKDGEYAMWKATSHPRVDADPVTFPLPKRDT